MNKTPVKHFRDLEVYKIAFEAAMEIYSITNKFPRTEKFSLVNQIIRSSRSVCSNIAEAWRKRKYRAAFVNKLTDAMSEPCETQTWLDFCLACRYIPNDVYKKLDNKYELIIVKLNAMERKADSFCFKSP